MVDRVLHPAMRWRQYVVSFPPELARALCFRGKLASAVTGIVRRALTEWQRSRAQSGGSQARPGGLIFIQRHTDSLDPWFHLHILSPDGLFRDIEGSLDISLEHQPPPTPQEVSCLLETISRRVIRYLARSPQVPPDDPLLVRCSQQRATPLRGHANPPSTGAKRPTDLLAEHQGFTLHAATSVAPHDSAGLERRVRYMSRPALSRERIDMTTSEEVVLNLKKTRKNGVRRVILTPHAFLARLCAILPRPMSNQTLYYGVLAAASGARPYCIPAPPEPSGKRPVAPARPNTMAWADLLRRVFAKDIRQCPCGGVLQVVAVIESPNFHQAFLAAFILSNQTPTHMTGGP